MFSKRERFVFDLQNILRDREHRPTVNNRSEQSILKMRWRERTEMKLFVFKKRTFCIWPTKYFKGQGTRPTVNNRWEEEQRWRGIDLGEGRAAHSNITPQSKDDVDNGNENRNMMAKWWWFFAFFRIVFLLPGNAACVTWFKRWSIWTIVLHFRLTTHKQTVLFLWWHTSVKEIMSCNGILAFTIQITLQKESSGIAIARVTNCAFNSDATTVINLLAWHPRPEGRN